MDYDFAHWVSSVQGTRDYSSSRYLFHDIEVSGLTAMSSDEDAELCRDMFQEPQDYREAEKPATYAEYTMASRRTLRPRLVGHNPLWVPMTLFASNHRPTANLHSRIGSLSLERRPSSLRLHRRACHKSGKE